MFGYFIFSTKRPRRFLKFIFFIKRVSFRAICFLSITTSRGTYTRHDILILEVRVMFPSFD